LFVPACYVGKEGIAGPTTDKIEELIHASSHINDTFNFTCTWYNSFFDDTFDFTCHSGCAPRARHVGLATTVRLGGRSQSVGSYFYVSSCQVPKTVASQGPKRAMFTYYGEPLGMFDRDPGLYLRSSREVGGVDRW
jgi:hypothetical protein